MKKYNTSMRLKQIMSDRGLRQIDILNQTRPFCQQYNVKMNKSDISQYCSGKTEPNQDKLFVLGSALNVSEAWLMGYDVPMTREFDYKITFQNNSSPYHRLLAYYNTLNSLGQKEAEKRIEELTHISKYTTINPSTTNNVDKNNILLAETQASDYHDSSSTPSYGMISESSPYYGYAAHKRTDIESTAEGQTHDISIMNDNSEWK